jgi:hypothetical protein
VTRLLEQGEIIVISILIIYCARVSGCVTTTLNVLRYNDRISSRQLYRLGSMEALNECLERVRRSIRDIRTVQNQASQDC